jgi:hypothetical protein
LLSSDAGIDAGGGQGGPWKPAAPSRSGANGGALSGPATLPAVWRTPAAEGRRPRWLRSLFGVVEVRAPRFDPCRCSVTLRATISPVAEIMPDCCTPEYERVLANLGAPLPYRRARALLEHFFPIGDGPTIETIRKRALQVGARLEHEAVASPNSVPVAEAETIALSIDSGHVRAVRSYQVRTFEVFVALAGNDDGQQIVFSSVPVEADRQTQQLRGVLHRLGATPCTEAIILSDCAVEHIRWRLWHGQVQRALDLMDDTLAVLDVTAAPDRRLPQLTWGIFSRHFWGVLQRR